MIRLMNDGMTAVVFPGQGSQRPGMGRDFYDAIDVCRHTYQEASTVLGWDVAAICFGDDARLNLTEYVQPCILTTEIAMLRGLQTCYVFSPRYFGGHSLGEYTALVAAGALPFSDALRTVRLRGQLMQDAVPVGVGSMEAVIAPNLDLGLIRESLQALPIDVANDNSTHQVVISGQANCMPEAEEKLAAALGEPSELRFVPLNVSAPFHSRFMNIIRDAFKDALEAILTKIMPMNASAVTSNFTGRFHSRNSKEIIDQLVEQLSGTVQWRQNMTNIAAAASSIFEIGPSRPLRGFFKQAEIACQSITTLSAAERIFKTPLNDAALSFDTSLST
jgi:[acyl-carrier-protein] S-malonyltransferase